MADMRNLLIFLITVHTVMFFAGVEGLRPYQSGDNPHQAFLNNASSDQFQESVQGANNSGIVPDNFGVAFNALDGIDILAGLLTSPYSLFDNTELPAMFKTLFKVLLGFLEAYVVLSFIRGIA